MSDLVKVSGTDGREQYLENKITAGSNITITKVSSGGVEYLQLDVTDQVDETVLSTQQDGYLVKVDGDDTVPAFLSAKLVAGDNVTLTVVENGGNKYIQIDVLDQSVTTASTGDGYTLLISGSDSTPDYLQNKLTAGDNVTFTVVSTGGVQTLRVDVVDQTVESGSGLDSYQGKVSSDDTTPNFLYNKLIAGSNIELTVINDGGNETIRFDVLDQIDESLIGAFQDGYTVKISSDDTTANTLYNKLVAGSNVELTVVNDGGNETLRIDVIDQIDESLIGAFQDGYTVKVSSDDSTAQFLQQKITAGSNITITAVNNGGIQTMRLDVVQEDVSYLEEVISFVVGPDGMDGYASKVTETEHHDQLAAAILLLREAADGYGQGATETEHYHQLSEINSQILSTLDGYVNDNTWNEFKTQYSQVIQDIKNAADGYNLNITEHYNQLSNIAESIVKDLDGYNQTISEHYHQQATINKEVLTALDGYALEEAIYWTIDGYADGDIYPNADNLNTIGDAANRWEWLYLGGSGVHLKSNDVAAADAQYLIRTFAGNGVSVSSGNGGLSTDARVARVTSIAVDGYGDIYIAEDGQGLESRSVIRKITKSTGIISAYAGSSVANGNTGDGGPATSATLNEPYGISFDKANNLYFYDRQNGVIRRIQWLTGNIELYAGDAGNKAVPPSAHANGPRLTYSLSQGTGTAVDSNDTVYVVDTDNNRIAVISQTTGVVSLWTGSTAGTAGNTGDGGALSSALLNLPSSLVFTRNGQYAYISDAGNNRVRQVDLATSTISNYAGSSAGTAGFGGDEGVATSALLNDPRQIWLSSDDGYLYIADKGNNRIRSVNRFGDNIISTLTGSGDASSTGDGGVPGAATVNGPIAVASDPDGYVYISEHLSARVRQAYYNPPIEASTGVDFAIKINDNNNLLIRNESTGVNVINITNDSKVGINTTLPAFTLDVNGDVNITGDIHNANLDQALNSIRQAADGYAQNTTVTEHYNQQQQINQTIIQALNDGYAGVVEGSDGYIAFFTGSTSLAGDNDLFWDRVNNRLGIHTITPISELTVAGENPSLTIQSGNGLNSTLRLVESATFDGGYLQFQGGSSPEYIVLGRHDAADTDTANDTGVLFIRQDATAVSIGGTYGLASSTLTISSTSANIGFLETNPESITSTPSLGKLYVGDDQRVYFLDSSSQRRHLVFNSDIDGYAQNWSDASNQLQGLRDASDGYGLRLVALEEFKNNTEEVEKHIFVSLDGYAQNFTVTEHYHQLSESIDLLRVAADGYGQGATEAEHWNQQGQINQSVLQSLDGYATTNEGSDGYLAFFIASDAIAGDNDLFWDRGNNRLGIRTVTPAAELEVVGRIKTTNITITDGAINSYVLTTDGSGNATWELPSLSNLAFILIDNNTGNVLSDDNTGDVIYNVT